MELRRQTCQKCQSKEHQNIIVREDGQNDVVYVCCLKCKAPVARYVIAPKGYYHFGRGFESYIKSLNRGGAMMSGKRVTEDFAELEKNIQDQFDEVQAAFTQKYGVE